MHPISWLALWFLAGHFSWLLRHTKEGIDVSEGAPSWLHFIMGPIALIATIVCLMWK